MPSFLAVALPAPGPSSPLPALRRGRWGQPPAGPSLVLHSFFPGSAGWSTERGGAAGGGAAAGGGGGGGGTGAGGGRYAGERCSQPPRRMIAHTSRSLPPAPCWSQRRTGGPRAAGGRAARVSSAACLAPHLHNHPFSHFLFAAQSSQDLANLFSLPPPPPPPQLPAGGPASSSSTSSSSWISAPCLFPLCPCPGFLSACSRLHPGATLVPASRALHPGAPALHLRASCLPPPASLLAAPTSWPGEEGCSCTSSGPASTTGHL